MTIAFYGRKGCYGRVQYALTVLWLFFVSLSAGSVHAAEDVQQVQKLLRKMSEAVRELSYHGLFTYEYGGSLDTLKVIHTVREGVEYERLQHLSGPEREFLRSGQSVDCLPPGDQLLRGRMLSIGKKSLGLEQNYDFYIREGERIAGREAVVLQVVPKDTFRYGYTIGIDVESGLPLKSLLVGNNKRVLERFQFVELDVGAVDDEQLQPAYNKHWVAGHPLKNCDNRITPSFSKHWKATWLPRGFLFTGQRKTESDGDMLMFTDGLTAFSVFIDPVIDKVLLEGKAHRGATVAFMSRVVKQQQPFSVIVVGEIPDVTAQRVASSIKSIP